MKIVIGYPPLESKKGTPLLSQNRQFQWSLGQTVCYPIVPAYAATLLKSAGHNVLWLDGIAERWTGEKWRNELEKFEPDILMIETKTPIVKKHWKAINELKIKNSKLKIVLVGDHVTALPEESMENSKVDYILTGGNYDFLLLNLVKHLESNEKLEPGIWYRLKKSKIKNPCLAGMQEKSKINIKNEKDYADTGRFILNHDLSKLPFIDRELTKWQLYAYENGNFKKRPGTYIMAGRDCWWRREGGCTFCSWTTLYPKFSTRSVENVLDEIGELVEKYQVKEIFDDTGTFPVGLWLKEFCQGIIERGYHQKVNMGCNLRFGVLKKADYQLLAKAGFRFLLYGLESASQSTIDRLVKGINPDKVEEELKIVKEASLGVNGCLEPHVTCMVGYPWETKEEAEKTIELTKSLFDKGLIDTLQATIVVPYPGTKLFEECRKNDWLKTLNWDDFDMKKPVMKSLVAEEEIFELTQKIYRSFATPKFILRKIASVRSLDDFFYYLWAGKKTFARLLDFKK